MSKTQVILMSFVVAIPAVGLLVALVHQGMENGSEVFSGAMTVFVSLTALLVLVLGLSPFVLMGLYPTDGFAAMGPPLEAPAAPPSGRDHDSFAGDENDGGEFEDGDDFESDEAGGEELFDDGYDDDEFDDDLGDFDDDEDEWE